MIFTFRAYDPKKLYTFNSSHFHPKTFVLNYLYKEIFDSEKKFLKEKDDGSLWIEKPIKGFGGAGIKIVRNLTEK